MDGGGRGVWDTRQEICLDDARLIGDINWRQTPQSFDAISLEIEPTDTLTLYGAYVDRVNTVEFRSATSAQIQIAPLIGRTRARDVGYLLLCVPGIVVGAAQLGQITLDMVFGVPVIWVALAGIFLGLLVWSTSPLQAMTHAMDSPLTPLT